MLSLVCFEKLNCFAELEVTQWRVQWESGKVSQFSSNIFKSDISDLKQQIKDFAETWVSRLEELEKKQEQEINELKNEENKVRILTSFYKEDNKFDMKI